MFERIQVEVRAEPGVEHRQDILVERGSDPGTVAVGGNQCAWIFDQVDTEQERVGPRSRERILARNAARRSGPMLIR